MRGAVVASLGVALVAFVPAAVGTPPPVTSTGILYALDAKNAAIAPSGASMRLSMPANTTVTWFTDRPQRRSGSMRLSELASTWKARGFAADPPNAALLVENQDGERTHVVEMTKPQASRTRVSFAIRPISTGIVAGHSHTHDLVAGNFTRARLFIDDVPRGR